jgi:hypothetical protein
MTRRPSIADRIGWSRELGSTEARVLVALASCGDYDTGRRCYPKLATIAERARVSMSTVTRTLRSLKDPAQPGGPWIVATAKRHRHSTTYDVCVDRLPTGPPARAQQLPIPVDRVNSDGQNDHQNKSDGQNDHQERRSDGQNDQPTYVQDLYPYTHTTRAGARTRADGNADGDPLVSLPLIVGPAPARCAHPHAHAWCEGRVHVPRNLHFEFFDRLGTRPGESAAAKAGRLIAFYAATMAATSPAANIGDPYRFWKTKYSAWVDAMALELEAATARPAERDPPVYWADECKALHDGTCAKQWDHEWRMREARTG